MRKKLTFVSGTQPDESISPREAAHRQLAREAACEGIVLLENDGCLPLEPGRIALYGSGAVSTIKGGTGSGEVNERYSVSIAEGLRNAGFTLTSEAWLEEYQEELRSAWKEHDRKCREAVKASGQLHALMDVTNIPFVFPLGRAIDAEDVRISNTDTAVYVIARQAGESGDKKLECGDYDLYPEEADRLRFLSEHYAKTILVINSGSSMDLTPLDGIRLSAVIYFCQQGEEGGNALGDILSGKVNPSGKLTDTWARSYADIPFGSEFSYLNGDTEHARYREGIYVGYRYFDSFHVKPRYAFGHGLSYTSFAIGMESLTVSGTRVSLAAAVRNTGSCAGKEVVQVYLSCPSGKLKREHQMLTAFAKTSLLESDAEERMELCFDLRDCAAYDTETASGILEPGSYLLSIGSASDKTTPAACLHLSEQVTLWQGKNLCVPRENVDALAADPRAEEQSLPVYEIDPHAIQTIRAEYSAPAACEKPNVLAVLQKLSLKDLVELCVGYGVLGMFTGKKILAPGTVGRTSDRLFHKGLVNVNLSDGPAGLRLMRRSAFKWGLVRMGDYLMGFMRYLPAWGKRLIMADPVKSHFGYQYCTAFPVETSLAQTWNTELCERVGTAVAVEMNEYNVTYWLAPAMNIHRNPLCGRNFEYYSEDPLLTGKIAAAVVRGVQSIPGTYAVIKHFACNNQEDNRNFTDSILSERTLREIYLKGFEICIRESHPKAVMSSYNRINGIYAANNYDLLTDILRNEWGFDGIVMTDWNATNDGKAEDWAAFPAGNDLIMPGGSKFRFAVWMALLRRRLSRADLERSASRIIGQILESNVARRYPPEYFR